MEGTKNINKKLLITIFTALFLIGSVYSVYSQATSAQNNAVSSLESNSIIQEIISSSANGYSNAGQYLANFLSIKGVPTYVWTIITFLMATLFFVAIYTFLFEIFVQKIQGTGISENETMKKAKILFIFTLSVFSALAIGYAIPFLFNLYGIILLILLLIALFFFGRATISYGKSFHYATKSLEANVKKDFINVEKALKEAEIYLPEGYAKSLTEGIEKISSIYDEAENARKAAEEKFRNILSKLIDPYEAFINSLINGYNNFLNKNKKENRLTNDEIQIIKNFIKQLKDKMDTDKQKLQDIKNKLNNILDIQHPDIQQIQSIIRSIRDLLDEMLRETQGLIAGFNLNNKVKQELQNILYNAHDKTLSKYQNQILSEIEDAINEYEKARVKLNTLYSYEKGLNDIGLRVRKFLGAHGNRKPEIAMSYELKNLENDIERSRYLVNQRINFLKNLKNLLH